MKKQTKKLVLAKETLRSLEPGGVVAAVLETVSCLPTCELCPTYTCGSAATRYANCFNTTGGT